MITHKQTFDWLRAGGETGTYRVQGNTEADRDNLSAFDAVYVLGGSHTVVFDPDTHTATIKDGEIVIKPKRSIHFKITADTKDLRANLDVAIEEIHSAFDAYLQTPQGRQRIIEINKEAERNREI